MLNFVRPEASIVDRPGEKVGKAPRRRVDLDPGETDPPLSPLVRKVDDHELPPGFILPAPGHKVEETAVVRPPFPLAETPLAFSDSFLRDDMQKVGVECLESHVRRFIGTAAQKYGEPDCTPLELPFMKQYGPSGRVVTVTAAARAFSGENVSAALGSS